MVYGDDGEVQAATGELVPSRQHARGQQRGVQKGAAEKELTAERPDESYQIHKPALGIRSQRREHPSTSLQVWHPNAIVEGILQSCSERQAQTTSKYNVGSGGANTHGQQPILGRTNSTTKWHRFTAAGVRVQNRGEGRRGPACRIDSWSRPTWSERAACRVAFAMFYSGYAALTRSDGVASRACRRARRILNARSFSQPGGAVQRVETRVAARRRTSPGRRPVRAGSERGRVRTGNGRLHPHALWHRRELRVGRFDTRPARARDRPG